MHIEPLFPWLMAMSIGNASAPRTSPTITRSGSMRKAIFVRSASVISPFPSMLAGRDCKESWSGCRCSNLSSPSSYASSIVTIRSSDGTSLIKARNKVVLPEPVPPAIITFRRERTMALNISAIPCGIIPRTTKSSSDEISN